MIAATVGGGHGESPERQRPAVIAGDSPKESCLPEKRLGERRAAIEIADHAAFGEHPVVISRTRPRFEMPPTAQRVDFRYPGVARKLSPGTNVIARPDTASTTIGEGFR